MARPHVNTRGNYAAFPFAVQWRIIEGTSPNERLIQKCIAIDRSARLVHRHRVFGATALWPRAIAGDVVVATAAKEEEEEKKSDTTETETRDSSTSRIVRVFVPRGTSHDTELVFV